jgi:uncharacterized iron-regulated membrane protein
VVSKVLFALHRYMALIAGLFIIIFGVTGSITAFEEELDRMVHSKLSYVTPQAQMRPLSDISAAVEKAFPGNPVLSYGFPASPDVSYQARLRLSTVYVNQYTGEVLGVRNGRPPHITGSFLHDVHQFHIRLLIRGRSDVGKKVMTWSGVTMLFLLPSGLYLWWPSKRTAIDWKASGRRVWFDVHSVVGIFSFIFLLLLTVTGVMIAFERTATPLFYSMTGSQPPQPHRFKVAALSGTAPITPDQALGIARSKWPHSEPSQINVPGATEPYFVVLRSPGDPPSASSKSVVIDPYTADVIYEEDTRMYPGGWRIITANRAIHG